jgi:crossover junction endodeoxyribonuclease RusA
VAKTFPSLVTLPYPPSVNNLYATVGRRRVLSKEGRAFKQQVGLVALVAGMRPLSGYVKVTGVIYRPKRQGDLDNRIKALLDALKGVAFTDDEQVDELHFVRREDAKNPRAVVMVVPSEREVPPSEAAAPGAMFAGETR